MLHRYATMYINTNKRRKGKLMRSPYPTALLASLPARAYAYRATDGSWSIRYNGMTYSEATREANANTEEAVARGWASANEVKPSKRHDDDDDGSAGVLV